MMWLTYSGWKKLCGEKTDVGSGGWIDAELNGNNLCLSAGAFCYCCCRCVFFFTLWYWIVEISETLLFYNLDLRIWTDCRVMKQEDFDLLVFKLLCRVICLQSDVLFLLGFFSALFGWRMFSSQGRSASLALLPLAWRSLEVTIWLEKPK